RLAAEFDTSWAGDTPFGSFATSVGFAFIGDYANQMYIAPAHSTAYAFASQAQALLQSAPGARNQFVYHFAAHYPGRSPDGINWRPHDHDLATVRALYRSQDMPNTLAASCPFPEYTPDQSFFDGWCATWNLPAHVTELYSPAPGVLWAQNGQVY